MDITCINCYFRVSLRLFFYLCWDCYFVKKGSSINLNVAIFYYSVKNSGAMVLIIVNRAIFFKDNHCCFFLILFECIIFKCQISLVPHYILYRHILIISHFDTFIFYTGITSSYHILLMFFLYCFVHLLFHLLNSGSTGLRRGGQCSEFC